MEHNTVDAEVLERVRNTLEYRLQNLENVSNINISSVSNLIECYLQPSSQEEFQNWLNEQSFQYNGEKFELDIETFDRADESLYDGYVRFNAVVVEA